MLSPPKSFGDIFSRAAQTLFARPGTLFVPFVLVHAAETLPWLAVDEWRNRLSSQAAQGHGAEMLFDVLRQTQELAIGLLGGVVILLLVIAAYVFAFGRVAATLRDTTPNYREAFSSLTWFGSVVLVPWLIAGAGIAIILVPLLGSGGWTLGLFLPLIACVLGWLVTRLLVEPLIYWSPASAAADGSFGRAAFSRALDVIRGRFGEYVALAFSVLLISLGFGLIGRMLGAVLPAETKGPGLTELLNQGFNIDALVKTILAPDARPGWVTIADAALDIGVEAARDSYVTLVVVFWYIGAFNGKGAAIKR